MISLRQRGRSGLQFLGSLQYFSATELRDRARREFDAQPEAAKFASEFQREADREEWERRISVAREVAERSPAYRHERLIQRYVAEENYRRAIPAVEEQRGKIEREAAAAPAGNPANLVVDPAVEVPAYYQGVEWHLEPGGWNGYDLQGAMFGAAIGPHVFRRGGFAAVDPGDDITAHRHKVVGLFRNERCRRIYEPGCGGVQTLAAVRSRYPQAQLLGGDLSESLLRRGHAFSEAMGWNILFRQEDARRTAEQDGACDGVISYALHHEMPREVTVATLREMFRILAPGGEMVISDVPPFRAVSPLQAVVLDWDTANRAEPYFTEAGCVNLAAEMRATGFVDVDERALGPNGYPWVTRGRKPG